ncbi:hypothetical protein ER308_21095 [Egibacter rhizosphaerae]|uniref:Tetratricopeptide repeat protein n=1 Tax=Egibacter rhizosphaerae TaxID=1670831 RepID=A0A411YKT0_9ACTN|nr:hypothetical protein [Egibacter rhizosphaerae]QBI21805.1 hypothetical protein ER308_21095 [Egibacter rhizosphaerae]
MSQPPAPNAPFMRDERAGDEELAQEAEELAAQLEELDGSARVRAEGRLGELLRMLDRYSEAETHLRAALETAVATGDQRAEVANRLRLATALQYQERHHEALEQFDLTEDAIAAHELEEDYSDFAAQHRGKCLVELGRVEEGIGELERALELRERKGDPELLASTDAAIEFARDLLE